MKFITITAIPPNPPQVPETVRKELVGLTLPLADDTSQDNPQMRAGLPDEGKQSPPGNDVFVVDTNTTLSLLKKKCPKAVTWFREYHLESKIKLPSNVCQVVP